MTHSCQESHSKLVLKTATGVNSQIYKAYLLPVLISYTTAKEYFYQGCRNWPRTG